MQKDRGWVWAEGRSCVCVPPFTQCIPPTIYIPYNIAYIRTHMYVCLSMLYVSLLPDARFCDWKGTRCQDGYKEGKDQFSRKD